MSFADRRRWPRFPQRADRRLPARAAHRRMTPPEVSARRSRSAGSSRFRCGARTTTSPTSGDGRSTGQARFASSPGRAGHSRGQCEADAEATRPPDGARDDPAARRPYQLIELDGAAEVLGGGHLDLTPINPFVIARRQLGEPLLQVADRPPGHPLDGARNDDPVKRPAQPGTRLELDDNPVTEARVILDEVALVPCCGQAALDARVPDCRRVRAAYRAAPAV